MAVAAMIYLIVPSLLNTFVYNPVLAYLSSKADPGFVYLILGVICVFMNYEEEKKLIMRRIPWPLVLTISGMAILIVRQVQQIILQACCQDQHLV